MERRDFLAASTMTAVALLSKSSLAETDANIIPWTDQPASVPPPAANIMRNVTRWEDLDVWITPNEKFFSIAHYNRRRSMSRHGDSVSEGKSGVQPA